VDSSGKRSCAGAHEAGPDAVPLIAPKSFLNVPRTPHPVRNATVRDTTLAVFLPLSARPFFGKITGTIHSFSGVAAMAKREFLRLPVVSAGAEYLVMGYLMRRNILAYKAPQNNEGYDLICIHPDPRHQPAAGEVDKVLVQVKSRYATDCDRGFPVKKESLNAFDFLIVAFLNIGNFFGKSDGLTGETEPEFYTLSRAFIEEHHDATTTWQKVKLRNLQKEIDPFKNGKGFALIAQALGIPRPKKDRTAIVCEDDSPDE
jgi:hypothetical protein